MWKVYDRSTSNLMLHIVEDGKHNVSIGLDEASCPEEKQEGFAPYKTPP